jgi:hypothetical protein
MMMMMIGWVLVRGCEQPANNAYYIIKMMMIRFDCDGMVEQRVVVLYALLIMILDSFDSVKLHVYTIDTRYTCTVVVAREQLP